ncbi:UNVERIFIED_CONTAM: hypothetical protein FKN15_017220 [Acipenser sinensis]
MQKDNAGLGSLQASPQAPGQSTGVAGARYLRPTASEDHAVLDRLQAGPQSTRVAGARRAEDTLADLSPPHPGQLSANCALWELPSTAGSGIAWTHTGYLQAIGSILHSTQSAFTRYSTQLLPCNRL